MLIQLGPEWQLLPVPLDQLPIVLARPTGLYPVTPPDRQAAAGDNPFDRLFADDEAVRVAAFDAYDATLAFTLGVAWPTTSGGWPASPVPAARGCSWLLEGTDGDAEWRLVPVPASLVYRRLTAILPGLLAPALSAS